MSNNLKLFSISAVAVLAAGVGIFFAGRRKINNTTADGFGAWVPIPGTKVRLLPVVPFHK